VTVFYQEKKIRPEKKKKSSDKEKNEKIFQEEWLPDSNQGQLVVDIYEKADNLVVKSAIAGARTQDIDITVEPDLVMIKGRKTNDEEDADKYYYQECFWGKFSRTLILPCPIRPEGVRANFKNGILTITLPKAEERGSQVEIKE